MPVQIQFCFSYLRVYFVCPRKIIIVEDRTRHEEHTYPMVIPIKYWSQQVKSNFRQFCLKLENCTDAIVMSKLILALVLPKLMFPKYTDEHGTSNLLAPCQQNESLNDMIVVYPSCDFSICVY